jgi:hypothetical protein
MSEFLGALLVMWPLHVLCALICAVPTFLLTRKRIKWRLLDCLPLVLPWLLWSCLFAFGPRPASLSSATVENALLGFAVGLGIFLFAFYPGRISRLGLLGLLSMLAIALWGVFPVLGE